MSASLTFCKDIYGKIIHALSDGYGKFLFWGVNEDCLQVLSMMRNNTLENIVIGIVDNKYSSKYIQIGNVKVVSSVDILSLDFDVLVITDDKRKENILQEFISIDRRLPKIIISGIGHLEFDDDVFYKLKSSCLVNSYATGYGNTLIHIYQTIKYLHDSNIYGDVVEFGIFKGGTISFIKSILNHVGYKSDLINVFGFDCFSGFPERESILDMYSNPKCEYRNYLEVKSFCERQGICVIEGNIKDTFTVLSDSKLMLTFFDTDNYTPVKAALEYCYDRTVQGGAIIFDHYTTRDEFVETIGERMAANEILLNKKLFHLHDTGVFIKL
jgi:hypothetical protein